MGFNKPNTFWSDIKCFLLHPSGAINHRRMNLNYAMFPSKHLITFSTELGVILANYTLDRADPTIHGYAVTRSIILLIKRFLCETGLVLFIDLKVFDVLCKYLNFLGLLLFVIFGLDFSHCRFKILIIIILIDSFDSKRIFFTGA